MTRGKPNRPTIIDEMSQALLAQLAQHASDDTLPTNARFLLYELEHAFPPDPDPNVFQICKEKPKGTPRGTLVADVDDLSRALTQLRENGDVDWDDIVDETRNVSDYSSWITLAEAALSAIEYGDLDPWNGKPPLVLTESRSLGGTLDKQAMKYRVLIAPTNGACQGFLRTN